MNHFPSGMKTTPIAKKIPTTSFGCKMGSHDFTLCCRNGVSATVGNEDGLCGWGGGGGLKDGC